MSTIKFERRGAVAWITMARPDKHNAFQPALIEELRSALDQVAQESALRVVVLAGEGPSFSAGADLDWMKAQGEADHASNLESAHRMADLFATLDRCPKPVIARVQGPALGGGCGLVCCADLAVAAPTARFGLTEVRLGLVAAVISPYVLRRLGYSQARAKMLTGERFDAHEALRIGMIHEVSDDLDARVDELVSALLQGSPEAQKASKELLAQVWDLPEDQQRTPTVEAIARARASEDGREGLAAFLERRRPRWANLP